MKFRFLGLVAIAGLLAGGAAAHHGWDWAEEKQTDLTGTIREIYIGPPHPTLKVETAADGLWTVELSNPAQTVRAGFVEGVTKVGDKVEVLGNRSAKSGQKLMKAVRLVIADKTYLLYPERIQKK
jgi:hypothetical protein